MVGKINSDFRVSSLDFLKNVMVQMKHVRAKIKYKLEIWPNI